MKKLTILFISFMACSASLHATNYNITISGTSYSPNLLTVNIGDNVTIGASTVHPLVQVSQATWLANGNTPLTGGWGTKTTDYTFNSTMADTIYFVCSAHVGSGMKGRIIVQSSTGLAEITGTLPAILLYPNPVKTRATLLLNNINANNADIKVFDITGQQMDNYSIIDDSYSVKTLDVSRLNGGIYFIEVLAGKDQFVQKFYVIK